MQDDGSGRLTLLARVPGAPFPFEPDGHAVDVPPFFADGSGPQGQRVRVVGGRRYGEARYRDDRVLLHRPPGFDPARPWRFLLFLHGHRSALLRSVVGAHRVPEQVDRSGTNNLLIAPQLARNAADSHPGKLSLPGGPSRLMADVAAVTAQEFGLDPSAAARTPVIVAAFSGGYRAAAAALRDPGFAARVQCLLLLDALYGEFDTFVDWKTGVGRQAFLAALHGAGTRDNTLLMARRLRDAGIPVARRLPRRIVEGVVALAAVRSPHLQIPVDGPPRWPIAAVLRRLERF